jgi:hypothetical protein
MGPEGIEAVGAGTVSAHAEDKGSYCSPEVLMNGSLKNSIEVKDGDKIDISLHTTSSCSCCEVNKDCTVRNAAFWVVKSGKEKGTMTIDKQQLTGRIKELAVRVAKRRMGLRN